jgi:hypothetical protein
VLEGHVRVDAGKVGEDMVTATIPAGAVRVPVDQPLGDLAIVLLEAESPDSFFQWGFMLSIFHEAANSIEYERNYNSGGVVADETRKLGRPVRVTLVHDSAHPSVLYVPFGDKER